MRFLWPSWIVTLKCANFPKESCFGNISKRNRRIATLWCVMRSGRERAKQNKRNRQSSDTTTIMWILVTFHPTCSGVGGRFEGDGIYELKFGKDDLLSNHTMLEEAVIISRYITCRPSDTAIARSKFRRGDMVGE
jgi:hypothetical protein